MVVLKLVLVGLVACSSLIAAPSTALVEQLIQPGPAGEDVAPYSFIPTLPRGNRETNWTFQASDDSGFDHSFRTFVRFPLPAPPANHRVDYAYMWFYYSFDSSGFGTPSSAPGRVDCHEILEDWDEIGVTWLAQPAIGPAFDSWTDINGFQLFFCDVKELVNDWVTGAAPNLGVAITNPTARNIGMYSFESNLAPTADYQPSLLIGYEPSGMVDMDADQVADEVDNCILVPNPAQLDPDFDGLGNLCDVCPTAYDPGQEDLNQDQIGDRCSFAAADLDGNRVVAQADASMISAALGTQSGNPGFDPWCDLDADGQVTNADLALWQPIYQEYEGQRRGTSCGLIGLEPLPLLLLFRRRRPRQ